MRLILCAVVAIAAMTIFPHMSGASAADNPPEVAAEVAALEQQIADLQAKIDALQTIQTALPVQPLADAVTGQCSAAGCGVGAAQRSTVRVSVRSGERRGLFRGRFGGRRGCGG